MVAKEVREVDTSLKTLRSHPNITSIRAAIPWKGLSKYVQNT